MSSSDGTGVHRREEMIEISEGLALVAGPGMEKDYPTSKIAGGLLIRKDGEDLSEEGVGFGLPVLKFGDEAAFPGRSWHNLRMEGETAVVEIGYELNLVSRLSLGDRLIDIEGLCRVKGRVDRLHRDHRSIRRAMGFGSALFRRALSVETRLLEADPFGWARVVHTISPGGDILVRARCWPEAEGCTEVAIMNEQGASGFDRYIDSEGLDLSGEEIGSWERTRADWGGFADPGRHLSFKVWRAAGAELFYGREVKPGRLAWAGLSQVAAMPNGEIEYRIEVGGGA